VLTRDIVGPDICYERSILQGPQAGIVNTLMPWPLRKMSSAGFSGT
jgi:hypothetical protein